MGSSGGGGTTTTTTKLSKEQRELIGLVMPTLRGYFDESGGVNVEPYPGRTAVPTDPLFGTGQNLVLGAAMGPATAQSELAGLGSAFLTSGAALSPESNPYLQQAINAAVRPITQNYENIVLGNIRDQAQLAGQYGYNRQAIEEGKAAEGYLRSVGDTAAGIANRGYETGLESMSRALAFAPSVQQMSVYPGTAVSGVATQRQALEQGQLDALIREYYTQQLLPLTIAEEIARLAFGMPGGSATSQYTGGGSSAWQTGLGGAMGGAAMGTAISPGIGTALGALVGGLLGAFS